MRARSRVEWVRGDQQLLPGLAALLFDPHDVDAIAAAIGRLLGKPRLAGDLARRGREQAARFSWERTARQTLASYERALAGRAGR